MATTLNSSGVLFPDSTTQTTAYLGGAGKAANTQTFNSSGTWTKPSGYGANSRVLIQCWGGGGAGGAVSTYCGGGGGGGYNFRWVALSDMGATETVTIGAGGTTTGSSGNAGGDTSLGSLVTAYGGAGGQAASIGVYGGGGGGQLSAGRGAGNQPFGGRPILMAWPRNCNTNQGAEVAFSLVSAYNLTQGGAGGSAGSGYSQFACVPDSFMHGGGGGSMLANCIGTYRSYGGSSVWGGGGGGCKDRAGGTSSYGGAGGSGGIGAGAATAGTAPGGGGGGGNTAGAGAAGRVIVSVFDGA